ncbi:lysylphosphatidylglycerol synthase transmembrane domain-containing protein [Streptomyces phytophilus]|uniref:lysylphosphatidylglycerol synthase transmembrane domain-containing protein n=1 Tax=Streptomyces phytophilus TaxID=722715 RepID=UPI0015F00461|nr:lysylphosphatidylglycerol synthase transmembrane domain-containing protein [Streptomyces phytophilus]
MRRDSAAEPPPAEPATEAQSPARRDGDDEDGKARDSRDGRDSRGDDGDGKDEGGSPRGLYDTPRPAGPRPHSPAAPTRHDSRRRAAPGPIEGDDPLLPARVHRPSDLMRLLLGLLGIAAVLGLATVAHATTEGLEEDITKGAEYTPSFVVTLGGLTSSIAVLIVPVAFAVERLVKRDGLRIADGVLAAVLAHGAGLAVSLWVSEGAPGSVQGALTQIARDGERTDPVHGYLAPVIAYMTAVGMARHARWRVLMWTVLVLDGLAVLVGGYTTPFAILLTVLIGWTVAYGTMYAVGSPNVRPTGRNLLAGLRRVGFRPVSALVPEEQPDLEGDGRGRRFVVTLEDGPPLDVTVVDREQQAQGFFYRAWRRLSLRGVYQRRSMQSLRQALEQEALLSYAAIAAGANAPKLIATSDLGPDAVILVYEHTGGRPLNTVPDEAITDLLMRETWRQVKALQSRRIAHRRLDADAVLVTRSGKVILTDLSNGDIAAGDVVLRMDLAQLLTTFALRIGAERAVAAAVEVLGPDAVADALPLLQPIALTRDTRAELRPLAGEPAAREREAVIEASRSRKHQAADRKSMRAAKQAEKRAIEGALDEAREEDVLTQIRQHVLLIRPQAPVEPVRIERIRPRTLVSIIAGVFAAYFLLTQLTHVKIDDVLSQANWRWAALAALFSAATYLAAALSLLGFVPERVPYGRTVLAQVAASFVKLVAPAAVGGVALNTRFLQKSGVRPGLAVASVGASQLFGLGSHILLLLTFGYLTGTERTPSLSPSRTVIAGLLAAAVLILIITAVPFLRKAVSSRIRSLFAGVVPRMLDVLQRPQKLAAGIGGMVLMTLSFVLCLDASVRAFGGDLSFASVAVVFLAGNALGSAAPTPGGVGAVELALTAGLTAAGMPSDTALSAVLLFRLLTFWMPVLPGWLSFTHLTRKGAL